MKRELTIDEINEVMDFLEKDAFFADFKESDDFKDIEDAEELYHTVLPEYEDLDVIAKTIAEDDPKGTLKVGGYYEIEIDTDNPWMHLSLNPISGYLFCFQENPEDCEKNDVYFKCYVENIKQLKKFEIFEPKDQTPITEDEKIKMFDLVKVNADNEDIHEMFQKFKEYGIEWDYYANNNVMRMKEYFDYAYIWNNRIAYKVGDGLYIKIDTGDIFYELFTNGNYFDWTFRENDEGVNFHTTGTLRLDTSEVNYAGCYGDYDILDF